VFVTVTPTAAARCLTALALICLGGHFSSASGQASSVLPVITTASGQVTIRATRIATPIKIDARLDDEAYRDVPAITGFIQQEPREGAAVSELTEAWVLFDDDNIYITCRCRDAHPETIEEKDMRRDSANQRYTDSFGVMLDTFNDKRNGYIFTITPSGGFTDALVTDERNFNPDWNTVWNNKAMRSEDGWIAEMAIPFKSLRYVPGGQTWGINIRRMIRTKNEYAFIVPMSKAWTSATAMLHVAAAATLSGIEVPAAHVNLEVKPYALSSSRTDRLSRPVLNNDVTRNGGVDVKYGITKALTADFTYRTDFAQVEDDEAQVNLTRFALSFPEKREFFLEGAGIFNSFGSVGAAAVSGSGSDAPTLFYSRRIGLQDTRAIPIIGGGRLTGKIGRWTIGALDMQADEARAADEGRVAEVRETNFGVLRLRRDVGRRSTIGAMAAMRSVAASGTGRNDMLGVDSSFSLFQNLYVSGYAAKTRTTGLTGRDYSYRGNVTYGGDRYGFLVDRTVVEDNFKPEIGFLRRSAFRSNFGGFRFSPRPARRGRVRQYHLETSLEYVTNTRNDLESREWRGNFRVDLQNGDQLGATYTGDLEALVLPFPIATGVRIPVGSYTFDNARLYYTSAPQHRISGTFSLDAGTFYSGTKTAAAYKGRLELTPRFAIEPNLSLNWIDLPQGAFTNTLVGNRATYTLTPRMFIAALVQYTSSTTSVLTNVRLRWEYSPGSEMFVVYSEGRDTDPLAPVRGNPIENRGLTVKVTKLLRF
jgi:hypothetical protein